MTFSRQCCATKNSGKNWRGPGLPPGNWQGLSQLIDALQLQERPREHLCAPVLLWPVLDDLVAEFGDPAHRKGVTLRVTTARGTALSPPVILTSILRNLVRNAIDYTPRGGRVSVASHRCGP